MRWQFGGNLEPVRIICAIDWRECPVAIINYVWSEIVTDVVDCLINETILWRVIAAVVVFTFLVRTMYSKTRWIYEKSDNRNNLDKVDCKVQDLEMRVNMLTYKMQYGTWPLPRQVRRPGVEGGIRNFRFTLSNSNDRTAWLEDALLSPSEHAGFIRHARIEPRSVHCLTQLLNLETKYMTPRFARDASPTSSESRYKYSRSNSNMSIAYRTSLIDCMEFDTTKNLVLGEDIDSTGTEFQKYDSCSSETRILEYCESLSFRKESSLQDLEKEEKLQNKDNCITSDEKQCVKDEAEVTDYFELLCQTDNDSSSNELHFVQSDATSMFHDSELSDEPTSQDNIQLTASLSDIEIVSEDCNNGTDETPWPKFKNYFQSKSLDIISEEQSAASSPDKPCRVPAVPETSVETEKTLKNESLREEEAIDTANEILDASELTLTVDSLEYFNVNNLEERIAAQNVSTSPRENPKDSCIDYARVNEETGNLHENIDDLVNQSVENIRDYVEVFSRTQNDAIEVTTVSEYSSEDSIAHFVSEDEPMESTIEEASRELSVPTVSSRIDDIELTAPGNSSSEPDFSLKRRPGSISLTKQVSEDDSAILDTDLLVELISSEMELKNENIAESGPTFIDEPSCTELLMDYLLETVSNFIDEKLPSTQDFIEFEKDTEVKESVENMDESREIDSPLTGRTVIHLKESFTTNVEVDSTLGQSIDRTDSAKFKSAADASDDTANNEGLLVPESLNAVELVAPVTVPELSSLIDDATEETVDDGIVKEKQEINEHPAILQNVVNICSSRNLSSDTSGMNTDISSHNLLYTSETSVAFDKYILNPLEKQSKITAMKKPARELNYSSLQSRIPWNTPKIGRSLSKSGCVRSRTLEKVNNLRLDKPKESGPIAKSQRGKSSTVTQIKSRSFVTLAGTRNSESSKITAAPRNSGKNVIDPVQRRSRSYATPRKSATLPQNSATSNGLENMNIEKSRLSKTRPSSRSSTSSITSKSCIPILKSRIKPIKLRNRETRLSSPVRGSTLNSAKPYGITQSPRILTIVPPAINSNLSSDRSLASHSNCSEVTNSSGVERRDICVLTKPSVINTSTPISDLQLISAENCESLEQYQMFELPKELTNDEYIVLLEALNKDPNLNQLQQMDKSCDKLDLGF